MSRPVPRSTPDGGRAEPRVEDIEINVCKTKKLDQHPPMRRRGVEADPPKIMSLEQCLDFIDTDELLR